MAAARRGARRRGRRDARSALNRSNVPSRSQCDEHRDGDDERRHERELDRGAPAEARAEQPPGGERDDEDSRFGEQRLAVRRVEELRRMKKLEGGPA